mmetsp:Transcript_7193/g.7289  ORF Transcript_7193/g.7289 Transcript_7193/m.7289 type:complete len:325 (-) Transcript_7193:389-1363(-)
MIFGDEPRFHKDLKPLFDGGEIYAIGDKNVTSAHVGPGAYYTTEMENTRTGWEKKRFSQRAPMTPEKDRVDRSHYFVNGVLLPGGGIARSGSPTSRRINPGPGHYNMDRSILSPAQNKSAQRPRSAGARPSSAFGHSTTNLHKPNGTMGTAGTNGTSFGQNSPNKSVLKGGIVYTCIDHDSKLVGPGYYNVGDSMVKKSFNVRITDGNAAAGARAKDNINRSNDSYMSSGRRTSASLSPKSKGASFSSMSPRPISRNTSTYVSTNGMPPTQGSSPKSSEQISKDNTVQPGHPLSIVSPIPLVSNNSPQRLSKELQEQFVYATPN